MFCFITSLMLMMSVVLDRSMFMTASAEDEISVTITDSDGNVINGDDVGFNLIFSGLKKEGSDTPLKDGDELKNGDVLTMFLEWDAGSFSTKTTTAESEFQIRIDNLTSANAALTPINFVDTQGTNCLLDYYLDPNDNVFTITCTPDGRLDSFEGYCKVKVTVNVSQDELEDGKFSLAPFDTEKTFTYKPSTMTMTKTTMGNMYQDDYRWYQNFRAELNVEGGSVTDVVITDTYEDTVFNGEPVNLRLDGDWTEGKLPTGGTSVPFEPIREDEYTITGFTAKISELEPGTHYLSYALPVESYKILDAVAEMTKNYSDTSDLTNTAEASYKDTLDDEQDTGKKYVSAQITLPSVQKSAQKLENEVVWTITVNTGTVGDLNDINASLLVIKDVPDGVNIDIEMLKDALRANNISYTVDGSGNSVVISPNQFIDYQSGNKQNSFSFSYSTPISDEMKQSPTEINLSNEADLVFRPDYSPEEQIVFKDIAYMSVGQNTPVGNVDKNLIEYDAATGRATWEVIVDIPDTGVDRVEIDDRNFYTTNGNVVMVLDSEAFGSGFRYTLADGGINVGERTVKDIVQNSSSVQYYTDMYSPYPGPTDYLENRSYGFDLTLNADAVEELAGKQLRIQYSSVVGGDLLKPLSEEEKQLLSYNNTAYVKYFSGSSQVGKTVDDTDGFAPVLTGKKSGISNNTSVIYKNYPGKDYPELAYWMVDVKPSKADDAFTVGQTITVKDTVSDN